MDADYVLITGAARRIGASIAKILHQRGCNVILHYHRSDDAANELAESLDTQRSGSAFTVAADLGDTGEIEHLAETVRTISSKLSLLVNNAARFFPTTVGTTTPQQWDALMGSNLRGPYFLTQALLPELTAAAGSVVNLLDVHALRPMRDHAVYCMAKAGLHTMTLALARDLGPQVRVNAVAPGAILWPEDDRSTREQASILRKIVLGRTGKPRDIASAVVFLGLDSPYITGQILTVDGGRSLNI